MFTGHDGIEKLAAQVEALQRQIVWLKRCGVVATGGLMLAFITGQTTPAPSQPSATRVVEGEAFVLKDSKGRIRGEWHVDDYPAYEWDRVTFRLRDSEGRIAAVLQNSTWESANLLLLNRAKPLKMGLAEFAMVPLDLRGAGSDSIDDPFSQLMANSLFITGKEPLNSVSIEVRDAPEIDLQGRHGRLALSSNASPGITMFLNDLKTDAIWSLSDTEMAFVARYDKKPRALWQVGKNANKIELCDPKGNTRAVLGTTDISTIATGESHSRKESSLVLFGEDGKVVFSAP